MNLEARGAREGEGEGEVGNSTCVGGERQGEKREWRGGKESGMEKREGGEGGEEGKGAERSGEGCVARRGKGKLRGGDASGAASACGMNHSPASGALGSPMFEPIESTEVHIESKRAHCPRVGSSSVQPSDWPGVLSQ